MNIKELRLLLGLSQQDLSDKTAIPRGRINAWEQRGTTPKLEDYRILVDFFNKNGINVTTQKFEYEAVEIPMVAEDSAIYTSKSGNVFTELSDGKFLMTIPLVEPYAYGGYLSGYNDNDYLEELPKFSLIVEKHHRGLYRAFQVRGDSMDDDSKNSICSGDIAVGRSVDKTYWTSKFHLHKWEDYIIVHKEGILIKRISQHNVENGIIICHSLNPDKESYPDFTLHLEDIYELYNVVEVSRKRVV